MLSNLAIAVGTYDGVVAGWEYKRGDAKKNKNSKNKTLQLEFATAVHTGSIRSLSLTTCPTADAHAAAPGSLLSCGYDETLRTHDWHKRMTSSGEVRTPSDFGTPACSSYAPPKHDSAHCIIGFSGGKLAIYKKRDWSVQHVLAGHEGGVGALAVHPSGKLALTGGMTDGKIKLWDLTKGRLAFVIKTNPSATSLSSTNGKRTRYDPVGSLVWSTDGNFYAFAYGPHITVKEVASGKDLLDVDLPSRANEICLMSGPEGLFVVAACDDGSLPVLAVEDSDDENRRAIMAIEPVDSVVAREERFKCIAHADGYYVVTANSAGVVSLMDLSGAVQMISETDEGKGDDGSGAESDEDEDDEDDEEEEDLAVNIMDSVQLGTGARITALAIWNGESLVLDESDDDNEDEHEDEDIDDVGEEEEDAQSDDEDTDAAEKAKATANDDRNSGNFTKRKRDDTTEVMDSAEMEKARALVSQAKKLKKKKAKKNKKRKST